MKGQFKKGKGNNVWYLIIFGDANVLRIVQSDNDYMRIKFESNDNLPADNIVNMRLVTTIIRSAFA